jgi:hypothetical protein
MSKQLRYWDYGRVYDNLDFTSAQYTIHLAGPYRGFALSASLTGNLEIAAGSGVLHDGFVWSEDDVTPVTFVPQVAAAVWTVVATHVNRQIFGGEPVLYELRLGYFGTVVDGAVLGWILYPGANAVLTTAMCRTAPSLLSQANLYASMLPDERLPPFNDQNGCFTQTVDPDVTLTSLAFDAGFFVVNQTAAHAVPGPPGTSEVIQHVQFYAGTRPAFIRLYLDVPGAASTDVTVEVYDTALAPVACTGGVISNTVGWEEHVVTVDPTAGTFTVGMPWTIRVTQTMDPGLTIRIARIRCEFWPFP